MWTHTIYIWTLSLLFYLQPPNVSSQTTIRASTRRTSVGPTVFLNLHGVSPTTFNDYLGAYLGYAWVGGEGAGNMLLSTCREECQKRSNPPCLSFDYNTQYEECFLHLQGKVDSCVNTARSSCPECLHYRKLSVYCGNVQTSFDERVQQQSFNGKRESGELTLERCLIFCEREQTCKMVDYNSADQSCWWHTQCSTPTPCITACSVSQYIKKVSGCLAISPTSTVPTSAVITSPTTEDPRAGEIYDDVRISTSYSGGSKVGNFEDVLDCQNECYKNINCQGVDYNTGDKSCWILTSGSVCGAERSSCTTCTHYKNKRAACYRPPGTQATTQAPPGTTQATVFSNFKPLVNNRALLVDGLYTYSYNLQDCLLKCNGKSSCHAAAYNSQGQCYQYSVDQACGIRKTNTGWLLYGHIRQTCGQSIYNDFHAPENNKRRPIATWKQAINSQENCLKLCKAASNCKGVNYNLVSNRCEHVLTQNQCRAVVSAPNYIHYTIKTMTCNPGVSTTTTRAPVTVVSQCWTTMTQRSSNCAKPSQTTANLALRIQDMENYCRTYNVYFECIVSKFRTTNCATVTRASLANYVTTLPDLRTNNIRFCRTFSQGLQTCLATNAVKIEIARCQSQVRPGTAIKTGTTPIAQCNKLRDYIECVRSVVEFRCREFSTEYYEKSTQYILLPLFSDCASKSEPKIAGMNTLFGPAKGLSLLEIRGRDIGPNDNPMLLFNATLNACNGGVTIEKNNTHFICKTTPRASNEKYYVRLRYISGSYNNIYFMTGNFTYKTDPLVTSLMPDKTVVGGGTLVTVLGTFLSYVVTPIFRVTREDNNMVLESMCRDNEEDTNIRELRSLVCEVPAITLPGSSSVKSGEQVTNVKFRTGLILDGETRYTDLTTAGFRTGNMLKVYGPPDIDENPEKSFEFKRFWPVKQTELEISGQYLDTAATSRDYTVLIGSMKCENLKLHSTTMTCEPPTDNPYTNDTQPPIIVKAPGPDGFQTGIRVGTLDYQNSIFDNDAGKYGLIGAGVGVVVIFVILIVICCCCCEGCACNNSNKGYEESVD